jgi:hypothetical protein
MVNYSKDDFEDMMNEAPPTIIAGMRFYPGTILRNCDPVAFDIRYHDYCQAIEEEMDSE